MLGAVSKDLDLRDRWLGTRELKRKNNQIPYHNTDKEGTHVQLKERAQKNCRTLKPKPIGRTTRN